VWAWVKVLGGLAILGVLVWRLGTGAFLDGLSVIDGSTLVAALGIGLLTTVLSAWRWCLVARGLGIRLPLRSAVADYYRALFLNAALPGGVLGDVHRAVHNGRETGDMGRGVRAVVLERSAGTAVFVVVGLSVLLAVPSPIVPRNQLVQVAAAVVLAAAVTGALIAWARRRRGTSLVSRVLGTAGTDIRRGLLARHVWPGILVSSAAVLAGHLATFLVAARAAGSTASFARLAPLMLLALLAMLLPLNVGGWGPREGVTAWAFGVAGLSPSLGLTIAVVYGVLAFAASLPGAAVLVARPLLARRRRRQSANLTGPWLQPTATVEHATLMPGALQHGALQHRALQDATAEHATPEHATLKRPAFEHAALRRAPERPASVRAEMPPPRAAAAAAVA
jgi:uncharacterized membrane protein YbhN (UPF0104 family)